MVPSQNGQSSSPSRVSTGCGVESSVHGGGAHACLHTPPQAALRNRRPPPGAAVAHDVTAGCRHCIIPPGGNCPHTHHMPTDLPRHATVHQPSARTNSVLSWAMGVYLSLTSQTSPPRGSAACQASYPPGTACSLCRYTGTCKSGRWASENAACATHAPAGCQCEVRLICSIAHMVCSIFSRTPRLESLGPGSPQGTPSVVPDIQPAQSSFDHIPCPNPPLGTQDVQLVRHCFHCPRPGRQGVRACQESCHQLGD